MAPGEKMDVEWKKSDVSKGGKMKKKRPVKYTSKGRAVIIPKKILTTSSDEAPRNRSKASHAWFNKGLEELRTLVVENPEIASLLKSNVSALTPNSKEPSDNKQKKNNRVSKSSSAKNVPSSQKTCATQPSSVKNIPSQDMEVGNLASSSAFEELSPAEEPTLVEIEPEMRASINNNMNSGCLIPCTSRTRDPGLFGREPNFGEGSRNLCNLIPQYSENAEDAVHNDNGNKYHIIKSKQDRGSDTANNTYPGNSTEDPSGNEFVVKKTILRNLMEHLQNVNDEYKEIKGLLHEIRDEIRSIQDDTDIANAKPLFAATEGFPLQTVEEFDVFEGDHVKQKKLYADLRKYGESKLREALNIAFKASMTDKLATEFTWYGDKKTRSFSTSKMASLLHRVVKKCEHFKGPQIEAEFKIDMMEVLRASKQRYRNSIAKKPRRNHRMNNPLSEEEEADRSDLEFGEFESDDGFGNNEDEDSNTDASNEMSMNSD